MRLIETFMVDGYIRQEKRVGRMCQMSLASIPEQNQQVLKGW